MEQGNLGTSLFLTGLRPSCQGAAAHPDSEEQQQRLREAAEGLRMATNAAAQNAIKKKLVHRLEVSFGEGQSSPILFFLASSF